MNTSQNDTIVALATASGSGAIAVIRLSGEQAIKIADSVFVSHRQKRLLEQATHTIHLGYLQNDTKILDQVLVSIFKAPNSYTGENVVEISCHGSTFIQQEVLELLIHKGARLANPGEFTMRAFLHGKMDLSQAEAVADLIAAESKAEHAIALQQMRGGFTSEIKQLRQQLINFASLLELELDFSEEDVEFADRTEFLKLIDKILHLIKSLQDSFQYGNVIKQGVPVAILGKPNAGKSSLLNGLLNEERAIVSDIPGTTRDSIEDTLVIGGIKFRFIDTAGLRQTADKIEAIGVERAMSKAQQASILLYVFDRQDITAEEIYETVQRVYRDDLIIILLENKIDLHGFQDDTFSNQLKQELIASGYCQQYLPISAHNTESIEQVKALLTKEIQNLQTSSDTVVTNSRHLNALHLSLEALYRVKQGLQDNLSGDLVAIDIRDALRHLGTITGEVDVDQDILGTIFSKFCIGK